MQHAIEYGYTSIVKLLLDQRAELSWPSDLPPLHRAAENGHASVTQLLLSRGADVRLKDAEDKEPLHHAAFNDAGHVAKLLLDHGASLTAFDERKLQPFASAADGGYPELMEMLLKRHAPKSARGYETAAVHAASKGHLTVLKKLLEWRADLSRADSSGKRLVDHAEFYQHKSVASFLRSIADTTKPRAINKSLFTLGQVISQLSQGRPERHVPYRNSKLTQLLQDSFGGSALCLMVTCISPPSAFAEETAMNIQNTPILQLDEQQRVLFELRSENAQLRRELEGYKHRFGALNGGYASEHPEDPVGVSTTERTERPERPERSERASPSGGELGVGGRGHSLPPDFSPQAPPDVTSAVRPPLGPSAAASSPNSARSGSREVVAEFLAKGSKDDVKHQRASHACVVCTFLYVVMLLVGTGADALLADDVLPSKKVSAWLLLLYWSWLVLLRLRCETGSVASDVYQLMFSCNFSMPMAAAAILLQRPVLLCAQGILVAIDQVLWYVDLLGYLFLGKLPVKVVGYLLWPSTPLSRRISCIHHVLFEPLVIYVGSQGQSLPVGRAFLVALLQTIVCQAICRYTTPLEIQLANGEVSYLNINLCYECFRDVKVAWIRRYDRAKPAIYLPWMLWIWNGGNLLLFLILACPLLWTLNFCGIVPHENMGVASESFLCAKGAFCTFTCCQGQGGSYALAAVKRQQLKAPHNPTRSAKVAKQLPPLPQRGSTSGSGASPSPEVVPVAPATPSSWPSRRPSKSDWIPSQLPRREESASAPGTSSAPPKVFRGSREISEEISTLTAEQLEYLDHAKWTEWQVDFGQLNESSTVVAPQHVTRPASGSSSGSGSCGSETPSETPREPKLLEEQEPKHLSMAAPASRSNSDEMSMAELNLKLSSMARGFQRNAAAIA
eukprot:symbB.v1.2.002810.t1/scaffold91.1/size338584/15